MSCFIIISNNDTKKTRKTHIKIFFLCYGVLVFSTKVRENCGRGSRPEMFYQNACLKTLLNNKKAPAMEFFLRNLRT